MLKSPSTISTRTVGDVLVISVLDRRLVEQDHIDRLSRDVSDAVKAAGASNVIVDFQRVEFLSSSAISVLIQLNNRLRENSGALTVAGLCPPLQQVFKIMKLQKMMKICETVEQAAGSFK